MIKDLTKKISYNTIKVNRRLGEFVEDPDQNELKKKEILEVVH